MIVLDTTVLVYAKGADHPLRASCRGLIDAVSGGRLKATTTAEVIQEFLHVRSRRRSREDAAALAREYVELLSPLIPLSAQTLLWGISTYERSPQLGSFDAVLAASAVVAGADALVSADTAFASVPGLRHVVPDAAGVEKLLAQNAGDSV